MNVGNHIHIEWMIFNASIKLNPSRGIFILPCTFPNNERYWKLVGNKIATILSKHLIHHKLKQKMWKWNWIFKTIYYVFSSLHLDTYVKLPKVLVVLTGNFDFLHFIFHSLNCFACENEWSRSSKTWIVFLSRRQEKTIRKTLKEEVYAPGFFLCFCKINWIKNPSMEQTILFDTKGAKEKNAIHLDRP